MRRTSHAGFTLIELMVTVGLIAILLGVGVPSLGHWIARAGVTTSAENIQNGLRQAQAEAVRRNAAVDFILTTVTASSITAATTAAPATTGWQSWAIRLSSDNSVIATADLSADAARATLSTSSAAVNALRFNGFGQVTTTAGVALGAPAIFDIRNTDPSVRSARCVYLTPAGAVKVCNPSLPNTNLASCAITPIAANCAAP